MAARVWSATRGNRIGRTLAEGRTPIRGRSGAVAHPSAHGTGGHQPHGSGERGPVGWVEHFARPNFLVASVNVGSRKELDPTYGYRVTVYVTTEKDRGRC